MSALEWCGVVYFSLMVVALWVWARLQRFNRDDDWQNGERHYGVPRPKGQGEDVWPRLVTERPVDERLPAYRRRGKLRPVAREVSDHDES